MTTNTDEIRGWFLGRLPDEWFSDPADINVDREEIQVVGTLPDVKVGEEASEATAGAARTSRIGQWREDTREQRMAIAREAQHRFGKKVSWGARIGDQEELFTTLAMPVMTRLRMPERQVLDTLVKSGVARSRAHALAWCVRLVGENQAEWIGRLEHALEGVKKVAAEGPGTGRV